MTFDAFVFVTPEYNHSTSGALKNAIDFLFREWNDKAAGFVGYGGVGGVRAVENLRLVMGEIKVADVRAQVALSMYTDFENFSTFKPRPQQQAAVNTMLDDLIAWGEALKAMRMQAPNRAVVQSTSQVRLEFHSTTTSIQKRDLPSSNDLPKRVLAVECPHTASVHGPIYPWRAHH